MKLTMIKVSADHIARGTKCDECNCPVALAIKEIVADGVYVQVCGDEIDLGGDLIQSARQVEQFVFDFDKGLPVEPFEFALEVPERLLKGGE